MAKSLFAKPAAVQMDLQSEPKTYQNDLKEANQKIINNYKIINESLQQIDQLKCRLDAILQRNRTTESIIDQKEERILELENELKDCNGGIEMLTEISEKSITKVVALESEMLDILREHENEMDCLNRTFNEVEEKYENLKIEQHTLVTEMMDLKEQIEKLKNQFLLNENVKLNSIQLSLDHQMQAHKLNGDKIELLNIVTSMGRENADLLADAEENDNLLNEMDAIKFENQQMASTITDNEQIILRLSNEITAKNTQISELQDAYDMQLKATNKKYDQLMSTQTELNEMKIKEIESIFILERTKTANSHAVLVKRLRNEIDHNNEITEEKLRISEVQSEQRQKDIQSSLEICFENEKQFWKSEMDKCQKIAETEIMQCEFEKQDLQAELDAIKELIKEKDEKIDEIQVRLCNEIARYTRYRDELTVDLNQAREDCSRAQTDKFNYQQTLNNTRSTVTILMERLTKSDSDVELLKQELELAREAQIDAEKRNLKITKDLTMLQEQIAVNSGILTTTSEWEEDKLESTVFEKQISSESETPDTVHQIGKLSIDENNGKYYDKFNELKLQYDARENYILDMKALLDEFASGIELARMELGTKELQLEKLQTENQNIKLEIMTYKFKWEQIQKYNIEPQSNHLSSDEEDEMVPKNVIADIITELESESEPGNNDLYSDEENASLKDKLSEKCRQIGNLLKEVYLKNLFVYKFIELFKIFLRFLQKLSHLQFDNQEVKLEELNKAPGTSTKSQDKENQPNITDHAGCSMTSKPLRPRNHQAP